MTTMTTLPRSRPLTYDDLEGLPDDGHRYELIDGMLVVTPAPSLSHQRTVGNLYVLLRDTCPDDLEVFLAPTDVVLANDTVMQPDVLVARKDDLTTKNVPAAPVLAVEVALPSTRLLDRTLKRARLEEAGCENYWIVDPIALTIMVWRLEAGSYVEIAEAAHDDRLVLKDPYPLDVTPTSLGRS